MTGPKQVAEEFNECCINSVTELIECFEHSNETECIQSTSPEENLYTNWFELPIITAEFVKKEIQNVSADKATGNDGISIKFLKLIFDISVVINSLIYIYNISLSSVCFPKEWKTARVKPIFKAGNKSQVSTARPISILSVVTKVIERAAHKHLLEHLILNRILCPIQFGFRPHHSCETAL